MAPDRPFHDMSDIEPDKSFVFPGDELAWLLSRLPGPLPSPLQAIRKTPFQEEAVRRSLGEKGVLQGEGLAGVVAFVIRALAGGEGWLSLPPALLVRAPKLYVLLTPYERRPGAWRITPCPGLAGACALLPPPGETVELGRRGEAPRTLPAPQGPLYDWLVEQWS